VLQRGDVNLRTVSDREKAPASYMTASTVFWEGNGRDQAHEAEAEDAQEGAQLHQRGQEGGSQRDQGLECERHAATRHHVHVIRHEGEGVHNGPGECAQEQEGDRDLFGVGRFQEWK